MAIRSYHFLPTKFAYNWIQIDVFDWQWRNPIMLTCFNQVSVDQSVSQTQSCRCHCGSLFVVGGGLLFQKVPPKNTYQNISISGSLAPPPTIHPSRFSRAQVMHRFVADVVAFFRIQSNHPNKDWTVSLSVPFRVSHFVEPHSTGH